MPNSITRRASVEHVRPVNQNHRRPSRSFDLESVVNSIPLSEAGRRSIPNAANCQLSGARGHFHRDALAHAMSMVFDVLSASKGSLSRTDKAAVDHTLFMIGRDTSEHFGNHLLIHLTALGAVHAGIREKLDQSPNDPALLRCMQSLNDSIVNIGVKAGKCKTVADGGYHGDTASLKLTTSLEKARKKLIQCVDAVGGPELLERIARVLLAEPLMNSIEERQANPDAFRTGEVSPMVAVHKQMADDLQRVIREHLDNGGAEHFIGALLDLIKLAEYVVQGDPGHRGSPESPARGNVPPPLPADQLNRLAASGSPINYQYAPVNVDNNVADLVRAMREQPSSQQPLQVIDIRNFAADQFNRGVELGKSQQLNAWQASIIADLQEQLWKKNQELAAFARGDRGSGVWNTYDRTGDRMRGYADSQRSDSDYHSDLDSNRGATSDRSSGPGSSLQGDRARVIPSRSSDRNSDENSGQNRDPIHANPLAPTDDFNLENFYDRLNRLRNPSEDVRDDIQVRPEGDGNGSQPFDTMSSHSSVNSWLNGLEDPDATNPHRDRQENESVNRFESGSNVELLRLMDGLDGRRLRPSDILEARGLRRRGAGEQIRLPDGSFQRETQERQWQHNPGRGAPTIPFGRTRVSETAQTAPHRPHAAAFGLNAVPMAGATSQTQPVSSRARPIAGNAPMGRFFQQYGGRVAPLPPPPPPILESEVSAASVDTRFMTSEQPPVFDRPLQWDMSLDADEDDFDVPPLERVNGNENADFVSTPMSELNATSRVAQITSRLNLDAIFSGYERRQQEAVRSLFG